MAPDWLRKAIADAEREGRILADTGVRASALAGPPARPVAGVKLSEAEFQGRVIDLARALGWRVAHFRAVRVQRRDGTTFHETPVAADGKGFPDLELVKDRLVKVELKVPPNEPTAEQQDWLAAYKRAGVEAYVLYPADWEKLVRILGGKT